MDSVSVSTLLKMPSSDNLSELPFVFPIIAGIQEVAESKIFFYNVIINWKFLELFSQYSLVIKVLKEGKLRRYYHFPIYLSKGIQYQYNLSNVNLHWSFELDCLSDFSNLFIFPH